MCVPTTASKKSKHVLGAHEENIVEEQGQGGLSSWKAPLLSGYSNSKEMLFYSECLELKGQKEERRKAWGVNRISGPG